MKKVTNTGFVFEPTQLMTTASQTVGNHLRSAEDELATMMFVYTSDATAAAAIPPRKAGWYFQSEQPVIVENRDTGQSVIAISIGHRCGGLTKDTLGLPSHMIRRLGIKPAPDKQKVDVSNIAVRAATEEEILTYYTYHHPRLSVRMNWQTVLAARESVAVSNRLGWIGLGLGILSLILSFPDLYNFYKDFLA